MTPDNASSLQEKASFAGKLAAWLLIIPSAVIGILLVEAFCWLFVPSLGSNIPGRDQRVVFFDGQNPIFQNHGDIFTYSPNNDIRNLTAFFNSDGFVIEYDYSFKTNNLGLTQDGDVLPGRTSLLLLGDLFTEGQGAAPWFRLAAPAIKQLGYQPINGGVLGTGFEQWLKLSQYLTTKGIELGKVVVIFISDDYHRPVWNIPPQVFQCLSSTSLCRIEDSYFYRLPPPGELPSWIDRVRAARGPLRPQLKPSAAALFPATYSVYTYFRQLLSFRKAGGQSRVAIKDLVTLYGQENVAFLHLPQKDELDAGPNRFGKQARQAIEDAGGTFFDGFKLCAMSKADYYQHDNHPNQAGYAKIAACTKTVINLFAAPGSQAGRAPSG